MILCPNRITPVVTVVSILFAPPFLPTVFENNNNLCFFTVVDAEHNAAASAAVISSALSAFKSLDSRYFIAGGTSAAFSHGITTPIDVIKTKIQSDPEKYKNKGLIQTAVEICKTDGPIALAAGLGPTVVGYGIEGAMKFGIYEVMKTVFIELLGASNKASAFVLASIIAGSIAAVLLCPMEAARIKLVTDKEYEGVGFHKCIPKMIRDEGCFASFSGVYAMLAKQVPYTFGKQVSFDVFATLLYTFFHTIQYTTTILPSLFAETNVKWMVSILSALSASFVACILSQPGDVILTETFHKQDHHQHHQNKKQLCPPVTATTTQSKQQSLRPAFVGISSSSSSSSGTAQHQPTVMESSLSGSSSDRNSNHRSFLEVVQGIHSNGGIPAFFTGTGARIVHVGLIITTQLVVYDTVKQLLGLPATGSH